MDIEVFKKKKAIMKLLKKAFNSIDADKSNSLDRASLLLSVHGHGVPERSRVPNAVSTSISPADSQLATI